MGRAPPLPSPVAMDSGQITDTSVGAVTHYPLDTGLDMGTITPVVTTSPTPDVVNVTVITDAVTDQNPVNSVVNVFAIVPMTMEPTPQATGRDANTSLELRADGTLYSHNHWVGQFTDRRIVNPTGSEVLSLNADGTVLVQRARTRIRVDQNGQAIQPNGAMMSVGDDGTIFVSSNNSRSPGPFRFRNFQPQARGTAVLMAIFSAMVQLP